MRQEAEKMPIEDIKTLLPEIFIQVYRNSRKDKLNLALILGESRIYGFDSEGGVLHLHPIEAPETHVTTGKRPTS